jgi:uncharacterized membrane protein
MQSFFKISSYLLFFLNLILLFLLGFENYISVNQWISPMGRLHPLVVHLPIGFVFFVLLLFVFKKDFEGQVFKNLIRFMLFLLALSTSLAALCGLLLSREGNATEQTMLLHKWSGSALSVLAYLSTIYYEKISIKFNYFVPIGLLGFFIFTLHKGAEITHGQNYLFQAFDDKKSQEIKETYSFSKVSESTLKEVNSPFCSVFPLSANSPALQADFFVTKKYEAKNLENLSKVKEQLVALNLSKMPINDNDLALLTKFENLETLNLNQTNVTGKGLASLKSLKKLQSISLVGIKINEQAITDLCTLPNLKKIYLWNTTLKPENVAILAKNHPKITFDYGKPEFENEVIKLNPPSILNENFIINKSTNIELKHIFKKALIRYTTDGSEPDSSTKNIYTAPIPIDNFTNIKAVASLDDWYTSKAIDYTFYKYSSVPDSIYFLSKTNDGFKHLKPKILIDTKLGSFTNPGDQMWIGWKETDFVGIFEFKKPKILKEVTVSYMLKAEADIMPPSLFEVWAGTNKNNLKLVSTVKPSTDLQKAGNIIASQNFLMKNEAYNYVKVVAVPMRKMPAWHGNKGKPAWLFIDEVFFN